MRKTERNFWNIGLCNISYRGLVLLSTMLTLVSGMSTPTIFRSAGHPAILGRAFISSSLCELSNGWPIESREAGYRASTRFWGWPVVFKRSTIGKRRLFSSKLCATTPNDPTTDPLLHTSSDKHENEVPMEARGLPKGSNDGFYVVKTYKTGKMDFNLNQILSIIDEDDFNRLELTARNISVPVALMLLDNDDFPSRSRARKACRKGNIMIHRGPLQVDDDTGKEIFDSSKCIRARVGDRVFPGDVIGKQIRIGDGAFPVMNHKKPPFDLPVVFEDDHFAICNKPAGIVVYANRGGGHGIMTVRAALPFSVKPPAPGTMSTLRRPQPVHRLDKPTSGLLIIAKTKPAMVHLSHQFRDRKVKKTYVAVLNGIPPEPEETMISSTDAHKLGVDVLPNATDSRWQIIDHALDEKHAITVWRTLGYAKSLKAADNYVTLVELKPKTGRYHQLRRHMAWVCERPIVGDTEYDGGGTAIQLRGNGLFLCSNRVTLEHPFYNSPEGRLAHAQLNIGEKEKLEGIWVSDDGTVMVSAEINIPSKFDTFMTREEDRYNRLARAGKEKTST